MKKLLFAAVVAGAIALPSNAFAAFTGVVVGKGGNHVAVATKSGAVRTVVTRAHPRLGARVRVNGASLRFLGVSRSARIRAIVVQRAGGRTVVAAGRSLLSIRTQRAFSALASSGPSSGAVVNATVGIANGQLTQVVGRKGIVTVQAQVTAVGPGTITVLVNGTPFEIKLPDRIQLPASLVGQFVTLNLRLAEDRPIAEQEDENEIENEHEDEHEDQNDDHGDHRGGDDHGGGDEHGGHGHG
jgi:hypothetical protein